jgi:hypothetical protein
MKSGVDGCSIIKVKMPWRYNIPDGFGCQLALRLVTKRKLNLQVLHGGCFQVPMIFRHRIL